MEFIPPSAYKDIEAVIRYYSPHDAVEKMIEVGEKNYISGLGKYRCHESALKNKIRRLMIMGCEPTIGFSHIEGILEHIKNSDYCLVLETNGIILGIRRELIKKLQMYKDNLQVVLSIKGGTEMDFHRMTQKSGRLMRHQYNCLSSLVKMEIPTCVSYMCGSGFENEREEEIILKKISEAGFIDTENIVKQDYIPFFVSEYKKSRKWSKGAIVK
jgi:uncharacterized Fe-S cluster-containing radical SAM superfamily protein